MKQYTETILFSVKKILRSIDIKITLISYQIRRCICHAQRIRPILKYQLFAPDRTGLIAGCYQLFETQTVEIHEEILHKIALERIVAITVNHFSLKLICIVVQLCLNLRQLCIELIVLCSFRRTEICICHSFYLTFYESKYEHKEQTTSRQHYPQHNRSSHIRMLDTPKPG